jgi:ATP-dependent Zn protease
MINLEEILLKHSYASNGRIFEQRQWIIEAMKEACKKTIDLCVEQIIDEEDKELQQCIESIRENLLAIKNEIQ